jgi:hypothetical protein
MTTTTKAAQRKTYIVKALNLNDVLVSQKIEAYSERQAAEIVVRKNKYLRVQSVEVEVAVAPAMRTREQTAEMVLRSMVADMRRQGWALSNDAADEMVARLKKEILQ